MESRVSSRRKIKKRIAPRGRPRRRDWSALPQDVMAAILCRVGCRDILRSARLVCSSWFDISKDPTVWQTVELGCHEIACDACFSSENLCRRAVDYSRGKLLDIAIDGFGSDRLLRHIVHRSGQIKCLRLRNCLKISSMAFCESLEKIPLLEELEIVKVIQLQSEALEAVARCCPHVKTLKFNRQGCEYFRDVDERMDAVLSRHAYTIAKCFPGLRRLQIRANQLTNAGVLAILDGCPQLELLDLLGCWHVRMSGNLLERCKQQIKHLLLPCGEESEYYGDYEATVKSARRLLN